MLQVEIFAPLGGIDQDWLLQTAIFYQAYVKEMIQGNQIEPDETTALR